MSNLAEIIREAPARDDLTLGPATIVAAHTREVTLRLEGGARVHAQLALALPYVPAVDDVVLALGKSGRTYVVGVLCSSGRTALAFHGDVQLQALGGSLELAADHGVRIKGREVELEAGELRLSAQRLLGRFQSVYQRIRGLLRVRAERSDTIVDESAFTRAKTASILTEETMSINGKQIHLG